MDAGINTAPRKSPVFSRRPVVGRSVLMQFRAVRFVTSTQIVNRSSLIIIPNTVPYRMSPISTSGLRSQGCCPNEGQAPPAGGHQRPPGHPTGHPGHQAAKEETTGGDGTQGSTSCVANTAADSVRRVVRPCL
jgi:hypothetical protein